MEMDNLKNGEPDGIHFLMEFFGCVRDQLDSIAFWNELLFDGGG